MKIQDLGFMAIFIIVVFLRRDRLSTIAGLGCLVLAALFFQFKILFTAERLTWYAAAFFLYSTILLILEKKK